MPVDNVSLGNVSVTKYKDCVIKLDRIRIHFLTTFFLAEYMFNVLDDLGLQPSDTFSQIVSLLEAGEEDYSDISDNTPQRLASAIANMRKLLLD